MPHELETFTDGTTAFASARLSAWHQLGTVTQDTMRAEEIMAAARLGDWGVRTIRTVGIDLVDGVEVQIPADDKRMTVRRNPVTGAHRVPRHRRHRLHRRPERAVRRDARPPRRPGRRRALRNRRQPAPRQERVRDHEAARTRWRSPESTAWTCT